MTRYEDIKIISTSPRIDDDLVNIYTFDPNLAKA